MRTAVQVRDLSVSFFKVPLIWQVLVTLPIVQAIIASIPYLRRKQESLEVLKELTFEIAEGSTFGVLGVNAAGKTTLVRALAGLLSPSRGTIEFPTGNARRGVIKAGRNNLFSNMKAMQHVEFVARLYRVDNIQAAETAMRLFHSLGMNAEDVYEKACHSLSYGTQAKVSLVLSLIPVMSGTADSGAGIVLLLDEPTLGMDVTAFSSFTDTIKSMRAALPLLTIVLATNDVREAAICDHYIALSEGRVHASVDGLAQLKAMVDPMRSAAEQFALLVDPKGTRGANAVRLESPRRMKRSKGGPFSAIWYRSRIELADSRIMIGLLNLTLITPNLIALLASQQNGITATKILCSLLGMQASLIIRESFRVVERERGYFRHIEIVLLAPVSRFRHLMAAASRGLFMELKTFVYLAVPILGVMSFRPEFRAALRSCLSLTPTDSGTLIAIGLSGVFAACAIGSTLILVPMLISGDKATFLVPLVPVLAIFASGLYYDPHILPGGLSHIAAVNPFSYLAAALQNVLQDSPTHPLTLTLMTAKALPGMPLAWINILIANGLSVLCIFFGVKIYRGIEPAIRRTGGYCTQ